MCSLLQFPHLQSALLHQFRPHYSLSFAVPHLLPSLSSAPLAPLSRSLRRPPQPSCALTPSINRRAALTTLLSLPLAVLPNPLSAAHLPLDIYTSPNLNFSVLHPSHWPYDAAIDTKASTGLATAFADPREPTRNMSVLVRKTVIGTPLRALGSPADFSRRLVQSVAGGEGQTARTARVVRAVERVDGGGAVYEVEYVVATKTWVRHNLCVVAVRDGLLYTLNMQVPGAAWREVKKDFREIASSFRIGAQ